MNDIDRWVNLEGPPPDEIREILDRLAPPMSPALIARLDAKVYAAVAEDRRREERRRRMKRASAVVAAAAALFACAGGAAWWVYRHPGALADGAARHFSAETARVLGAKASDAVSP